MFLALRELRFGRGRFALMGAVVALIAVLSVLLTGMATGLVRDGISSLRTLPVSHFAFEQGIKGDLFSRSAVDTQTLRGWSRTAGVIAAAPYGNQLAHATSGSGVEVDLAVFGVEPTSFLAPKPTSGVPLGPDDGILISRKIASDGIRIGDELTVDRSGVRLRVLGTVGESSFGHVGVVYAPMRTWQRIHYGLPGAVPATAYEQMTAVALRLRGGSDIAAADRRLGTHTLSRGASYGSSPGYSAETATMTLIRVFLYLISGLVVGAFFTVWTVQRRAEIALIKALGGSTGYLLRDAAAQVLAVVLTATGVGTLVGLGMSAFIGNNVPFSLEPGPIVTACLLLAGLGLLGAFAAVRRISSVDPLITLGAQR